MTSPRIARATVLVSAVALLATIAHPAARAQKAPRDPAMERARKHYAKAQRLFSVRKFAEALPEYQKAFQAKALPEFLFNIGQCHRNLDNYEKAIFSYRRYLALKPKARNRVQVEKLIVELEEKKRKRDEAARNAARILRNNQPTTPPPRATPFYKKWWFWTGVGAVAATTGAVLVLSGGGAGVPPSDLGNVDFGK